jgi:hypothetical protein
MEERWARFRQAGPASGRRGDHGTEGQRGSRGLQGSRAAKIVALHNSFNQCLQNIYPP